MRKQQHEAELRLALAEGLVSTDEADVLRQEALRLERGPLELLVERGRLSPESLVELRGSAREEDGGPQGTGPEQAPTAGPGAAPVRPESGPDTPAFPVSGWDRYQCVRFLGQGGMGRVFLAYDPRLRRNVALKFVRDDDAGLTRRIISEARAQARVVHERVCQVYEVGEYQGRAYIAMQYVEGLPLHELARELTVEQKAVVLRDVALGVHEAHRAGLIHRDLKPSNILVERTPDGGLRPYVMDFGLARDGKEQGTATGSVLGTPHYMAPEQARGEAARLDRRADVYSLGATLYQLLTGQPPIPGANALEVLTNIATVEPLPPRSRDKDIPADLEAITLQCLEKERSARYDSARALAEDLERFLGGEPVLARRAGSWYRLRKRLRKHRLLVTGGATALTLVVLALGQTVLARREVAERERLARRFTERVEHLEAQARYSSLAPLHDTRPDRQALRGEMATLEAEIREAGEVAVGPGQYALGQGFLALGDVARAREHLEAAWRHGYREPRVAYALALVMGRLYQEQLREADRLRDAAQRETRKRELERLYRDPALAYLRQSDGATVPSTEYVAALLAFYEGRSAEALARLDALGDRLPWFHEAPQLRGDIFQAQATRHWNQGKREQALADFAAARRAYARAIAIAESAPEVHLALAELEHDALLMELYGKGDVLPPLERGLAALGHALTAAPDHAQSRTLQAMLHRRLAEYRMNRGEDVAPLLEHAISAARAALELDPSLVRARKELGMTLWLSARHRQDRGLDPGEQLRQAIEAFEQVGPEGRTYDYHVNLGLIFKVWADHDDQSGGDSLPHRGRAIEAYRAAIGLEARQPEAWINLGIAYFTRASHPRASEPDEDLEQARLALDEALALNPQQVVPYFYGGQLHELRARRLRERGGAPETDLARALELYRRGIAINPRIPQLHNGLGVTLLAQAQDTWDQGGEPSPLLDQARAAFEQAMAVAPQQGFAYNNLGEIHARRATWRRLRGLDPGPDVRAADTAYRRAIERLPGQATPWANVAMVHHTAATFELEHGGTPQRDLALAEEAVKEALGRNPQSAQAWRYLGETRGLRARWRAGRHQARAEDFEAAAQAFQKALELAPGQQAPRVAFAHFHRHLALWRREMGGDPVPPLRSGLALAEEVLAARPGWPEARALHAGLLMDLADVEGTAEQRREWRERAREELQRALAANPHLAPAWKGSLAPMLPLAATSP